MGGAIFSEVGSNISINNSTFVSNSATDCRDVHCNGGALFIDSGSTVTAHNSTFTNNTSEFSGGAISLFQGTYIDTENVLNYNKASNIGGVVFLRDSLFTDLDSTHCNNSANNNGGVFTLKGGKMQVNASSFMNNTAKNSGGVLYTPVYWYKHHIRLERNVFQNNKAISGGVIAVFDNDFLMVAKCTFCSNSANKGGVIYLQVGK